MLKLNSVIRLDNNADRLRMAALIAGAVLFTLGAGLFQPAMAQKRDVPPPLHKTAGSPQGSILNINYFTTWMMSNGESNRTPSDLDGGIYPRGTAWVIYQDGLVWVGKPFLDSLHTVPAWPENPRVGGGTYLTGTRAGWISGSGANATAVDPSDPRVRVYRIRRDWRILDAYGYSGLNQDAAEFFEKPIPDVTSAEIDTIRTMYECDWNEWPVDLGAPYIERNGVPGYQPPGDFTDPQELITGRLDEPGVGNADPGSRVADMVLWTVYNDLDETTTQSVWGSDPLGLEIQVTAWGYKDFGALGHGYFKRYRLINKGGVYTTASRTVKGSLYIDSLYLAQWSDPDVGHFTDDLIGCDTVLSLGYAYNGRSSDQEFGRFGLPPPAVGYRLVSGPLAGTGVRRGMTAFNYSTPSSNLFTPPWDRFHRMVRGYVPDGSTAPWRRYPHPPGIDPGPFCFSGDPVTQTGFVDGLGVDYSLSPGDRRFLLSTGPVPMAPGDTQDVVIATFGGLGGDRLSSVAALKFNVRHTTGLLTGEFIPPAPPAKPAVRAVELDRQIVLEWGSNLQRVAQTEETDYGPYTFEGYTVYQLPAADALVSQGVRVGTFDRVNGIMVVLDEQFDIDAGRPLPRAVQFGTDGGVRRHIRITADALNEGQPLQNASTYRFAVTSYSVTRDPTRLPVMLESDPDVVTVRPQRPFSVRMGGRYGDTLAVRHVTGDPAWSIAPIMIDPSAATGDTYEVRIDTAGGGVMWTLEDISRAAVVVSGGKNFSGDDDYPLVDGVLVKVAGDPAQRGPGSFRYTATAPSRGGDVARENALKANVFPNPYLAGGPGGKRQVTFISLPPVADVRIYNLSGHLVRTLRKSDPSQFLVWDLQNEAGWLVASGMYLCHVEMPDIGVAKVLKLAVIQEEVVPLVGGVP